MAREREDGRGRHRHPRGDQPPILDREDERILDQIWDRLGREEAAEEARTGRRIGIRIMKDGKLVPVPVTGR